MTFAEEGSDLVELLFAEKDVLIFFVLVTLHDFGALHVAVANRAKQRLFEPRMTHTVELVKLMRSPRAAADIRMGMEINPKVRWPFQTVVAMSTLLQKQP